MANPHWVKGKSGNVKGRPRGIVDKRQRMVKAIGEGADALIRIIQARALEGDMQAAGLLIARLVPTLKSEASPIRFTLDPSLSTSQKIAQILTAVAAGQLTIEEALHVSRMVQIHAEALAAENGGNGDDVAAALREMARGLGQREGMPIPEAADATDASLSLDAPGAPFET